MAQERAIENKAGEERNRLGWKTGMAEDPASIFWVGSDGARARKVKEVLVNIDRSFSSIRRRAGMGIEISEVQGIEKKIIETGALVWDILIEVIPKLHNVPVERSFTLNDDRQEKRQKAKLFYSIGFLPRDPGVGHLAMAVKQIEETVTVLQQKDLEGLKRLLDGYERVYSHISELEQDLTKLAPPKNKKG